MNEQKQPAVAGPVEQELGPLPERVAAAGCPPPGWVEPGVFPSPVGRLYTQAELYAAVAAERERCAKLVETMDTAGHDGYIETTGDLLYALAGCIRRGA